MSEKIQQKVLELIQELGITEPGKILALARVVALLSLETTEFVEHYTDYDQSVWKIEIIISTKDRANQLFKLLHVGV